MTKKITAKTVMKAAKHAVKIGGREKVVSRRDCVYAVNKDEGYVPSCLVGYIFSEVKPDLFEEVASSFELNRVTITKVADRLELNEDFTEKALHAMTILQRKQDAGLRWGTVYDSVVEELDAYHG